MTPSLTDNLKQSTNCLAYLAMVEGMPYKSRHYQLVNLTRYANMIFNRNRVFKHLMINLKIMSPALLTISDGDIVKTKNHIL